MTLHRDDWHAPARVRLATRVAEAGEAQVLGAVTLPGTALAIWHRQPAAEFDRWVQSLAPDRLPDLRVLVTVDRVAQAVEAACDRAGTPAGPARDRLAQDVAALAWIFAQVTAQPLLRLSLGPQPGEGAEQFHLPAVQARLVCSYRGGGVAYAAATPDGPPRRIACLGATTAAIFRGAVWPGAEFPGILCRTEASPGAPRLDLRIDPAPTPTGVC